MNKYDLARDPNTSTEILEQLATDWYYSVRCTVARNPNTSPKVLEILATDEDYWIRYRVSINPNTPHRTKKYLKIQDHLSRL
jgi:hypothetical protein